MLILATWEVRVENGTRPTRDQLKDILLQNCDRPLPGWLLDVVIQAIDGELRAKPGRRRQGPLKAIQWAWAATEYESTLAWLQRREAHGRLSGWPLWQSKHWWSLYRSQHELVFVFPARQEYTS